MRANYSIQVISSSLSAVRVSFRCPSGPFSKGERCTRSCKVSLLKEKIAYSNSKCNQNLQRQLLEMSTKESKVVAHTEGKIIRTGDVVQGERKLQRTYHPMKRRLSQ